MHPLPVLLITGLAAAAPPANGSEGAAAGSLPPLGATPDQTPPAPEPAPKTENLVINTFFKDGLRFETADKSFKFKLGARIAFDNNFINVNNDYENVFGPEQDGARFRFARVNGEGMVNEYIEYKWVYDFSGGVNNRLKDLYIGFAKLCFGGSLRVGQFKEPMGLEQLTSAANSTFMERGAADALIPGRNIGMMYYGNCATERVSWAAGVFRDDGSDTGADTGANGDYIWTGRVAGAPYLEDSAHAVHVGLSARRRYFRGDNFTLTYSGETTVSKQGDLATLSLVNLDHADTVGGEVAWVNGPLSLQAEYVGTHFDRHDQTGVSAHGWYAYASYFLTGEHRPYDARRGIFGRVKVKEPKNVNGGRGAWEVALRASQLDLNDQGPTVVGSNGGRVDSYTAGANWYLNDYVRLMLNYSRILPHDDAPGTPVADVVAMRLQIDI